MNKMFCMLMATTLLWGMNVNASEVVSFEPSCRSHIIHRYELTSRDYSYLEFHRDGQPCRLQGIIGGEHQTFINVVAFIGDKYSVSLIKKKGDLDLAISGKGIKVLSSPEANEQIVEIEVMETFFTISPWAYPYGEYQLIIKKL